MREYPGCAGKIVNETIVRESRDCFCPLRLSIHAIVIETSCFSSAVMRDHPRASMTFSGRPALPLSAGQDHSVKTSLGKDADEAPQSQEPNTSAAAPKKRSHRGTLKGHRTISTELFSWMAI